MSTGDDEIQNEPESADALDLPDDPLASLEEGSSTAIDEILSAEILPEGTDFVLPEEEGLHLPSAPSFQLFLHSLSDAARTAMKKALEAHAIEVNDASWGTASPVVSQLTEYQAVLLLQTARALGVHANATVQRPALVPTEEDLALGDLSAIPEPSSPFLEAAPSVLLPKGEKDVLLCTPDNLPGITVQETFGIVLTHRTIARRLFREEDMREKLEKELRAVPHRSTPPLASSHLQVLLRDLFLDLRKAALSKGANAVLGVKIEAFPESSTNDPQLEQLRLVAFGTAAVVEKH